jgi:hypothetical protein
MNDQNSTKHIMLISCDEILLTPPDHKQTADNIDPSLPDRKRTAGSTQNN